MSILPGIVLVISLSALTGCATPRTWTHSIKGQSELHQDTYSCQQEAAKTYPPTFVQKATSGFQAQDNRPVQTNCAMVGNQLQCISAKTGLDATVFNRPSSSVTSDANARNRNNAVQSCLLAKGYRFE